MIDDPAASPTAAGYAGSTSSPEPSAQSRDAVVPTVDVQAVTHHFGDGEARKRALDECRLGVKPGEVAILTGPSGSGKTTLLTLVGGLRSVQEGSVRVLGRELATLTADELVAVRRQIGFIFQAHNLFESLTAQQNVGMALELGDASPEARTKIAIDLLGDLGLGDRIDYKPEKLSGGQRQRVAIARALANSPRLILADEPTAALDAGTSRTVVDLLRRRADEDGACVLLVTHDARILDIADRIVNMVDGRTVSNVHVAGSVQICDFLKRCPVFKDQTPGELAEVAQYMQPAWFEPGEAIVRQGEAGDKFYLIREGAVSITVDDGEEPVAELGAGDFFGEAALITGEPRNATVTASRHAEVLHLGRDQFRAALDRSKTFEQELLEVFFSRR